MDPTLPPELVADAPAGGQPKGATAPMAAKPAASATAAPRPSAVMPIYQ
jgi:hypothetical protein